jgi:hypothetical protein
MLSAPKLVFGASSIPVVAMELLDQIRWSFASYELSLQWSLLASEVEVLDHGCILSMTHRECCSISFRRRHIYQLMQEMLRERKLTPKDMVWPAVFACLLEQLVGNTDVAEIHRKAVVKLLCEGGFPNRQDPPLSRTMILNNLIAVGVPELFVYFSDIASLSERWSCHFVRLQSFRTPWHSLRKLDETSDSTILIASREKDTIVGAAASPTGPAYEGVVREILGLDQKQQRWYMAALFIVTASLYTFRHHADAASQFTSALEYAQGALKTGRRRHLLECTVMDMPNIVLLQALAQYIAETCGMHLSDRMVSDISVNIEEALGFVEATMMLGRDSKVRVLGAMHSWLPDTARGKFDTIQVFVDEEEIHEMRLEIAARCEELRCQGC